MEPPRTTCLRMETSKPCHSLLIVIISLTAAAALMSRSRHAESARHINCETYNRIENGMTLKQISELTGSRPDWTSGQGIINNNWASDYSWIKVGCDNDRVVSKKFVDAPVPGSAWADDWRRGLQYTLRSFD